MRRVLTAGVGLLAILLVPSPGLGQETDRELRDVGTGGGGFSRVIDDEETVFAVQRKAFLMEGKFELSLFYTSLIGDRFVATENSFALAGSVAYHFSEAFAVEVFGGYFFPTESETTEELLRELRLETEPARLTQLLWATGVGVQWSPIYGKFQLAGRSLGSFAFYLGAGAAVGQSRVQCNGTEALDPNEFPGQQCPGDDTLDVAYEPNTTRGMGVLSAGFRFRFLDWLGFRAEIRDYIFASRVYRPDSDIVSDSIRNNLFLQLGLSVLLGGAGAEAGPAR